MPRYFVELAYAGTRFHGWQVQENAPSVQANLNAALKTLLRRDIETIGCGRTDAGVHAAQFFAHFDAAEAIDDTKQFVHQLNALTDQDIAIYRVFEVTETAHARFDASKRSYGYYISSGKNPFLRNYCWQRELQLDVAKMNRAAELFLTHTDYASFCKAGGQQKTTLCSVTEAYWEERGELLIYRVSANRFLRGMVRAMVGTLIDVGLNRTSLTEFESILLAGDRTLSGQSVVANGLFLEEIVYPGVESKRRTAFEP